MNKLVGYIIEKSLEDFKLQILEQINEPSEDIDFLVFKKDENGRKYVYYYGENIGHVIEDEYKGLKKTTSKTYNITRTFIPN